MFVHSGKYKSKYPSYNVVDAFLDKKRTISMTLRVIMSMKISDMVGRAKISKGFLVCYRKVNFQPVMKGK